MSSGIAASAALEPAPMHAVRRETIFDCCKWDPQVEDVAVLSDFVLRLAPGTWRTLAESAEKLFRETLAAERDLARRPRLLSTLGLPSPLERALRSSSKLDDAECDLRVMRFDFHPTDEGWRISEVNSDVPGGYIEAAGYSGIMARHFPPMALAGQPVAELAAALRRRDVRGPIGLIHATAYTDDRQVMVYLQRELGSAGFDCVLLSPADLEWRDGRVFAVDSAPRELSALFRFFPVEWLPNLPRRHRGGFFQPLRVPQTNPIQAALSQSKRFPLVWAELGCDLSEWKARLPETRAWAGGLGSDWVSKPAFGRVGDGVGVPGVTPATAWQAIRRAGTRWPREWLAQRRFNALPVETPHGRAYPCIGVYVIDGRAAGIYGRIATQPLIDHLARDVAVLVDPQMATATAAPSQILSA